MGEPKFSLGQVSQTPGVCGALIRSGQDISYFLMRHVQGDWGVMDAEDAAQNDAHLKAGFGTLHSSYRTLRNEKIWVITEGLSNCPVTCLLLPDEY